MRLRYTSSVGNERTPWRIPLRSKLICAAAAVELVAIPLIVCPTAFGEKVLLVVFLCASPAIQALRVPVIKRFMRGGEWKCREDDAAWADWFASLFTGEILAVSLTDLAIRKLEIEPGWHSSTDVYMTSFSYWAGGFKHSLLVNLGGYGFTALSCLGIALAALSLDFFII